jgi:sulfur oxygenase/reductase
VFEIIDIDLPPLMGMTDVPSELGASFAQQQPVPKVRLHSKRMIVTADHGIMDGHEAAFEQGARETMQFMKEHTPGLVGWMLLKPLGVSAIGSFQLAPEQAIQALSTLGANPPDYRTNYGDTWKLDHLPPIPPEKPSNYVIHMEWDSPEAAQSGLAMAFTSPALRKIHNPGVLAHVNKGPYYTVFAPMMEEQSIVFP